MVIIFKSTNYGRKIRQNCMIFLPNNMSSSNLNRVCCCCWESIGINNKTIKDVNETVENLMRTYVFPGYKKLTEAFQVEYVRTADAIYIFLNRESA